MSDEKKPQVTTQSQASTEQSTLEKAIKAVAEQMIPAAVVAAIAATRQGQQPPVSSRPQPVQRERCHICGQSTSACNNKHVKLVVYPQRYPEHGEFFQGVKINGVRYLSNHQSHEVVVPASAVTTIRSIVKGFEDNEQDARIGRKAERRSGVVGPNGVSFNPALKAWR